MSTPNSIAGIYHRNLSCLKYTLKSGYLEYVGGDSGSLRRHQCRMPVKIAMLGRKTGACHCISMRYVPKSLVSLWVDYASNPFTDGVSDFERAEYVVCSLQGK